MGYDLTDPALKESQKIGIEPQLILKINGVSTVFGAVNILKFIQIGDPGLLIGDGWVIGGLDSIVDQQTLISVKNGTGTKIQQQLRPDQGNVTSVSSMLVRLLDTSNVMTKLITPGLQIPEMLGNRAEIFLGFQNTAYKEDFIRIFAGPIDDIISGAGYVDLNIAAPDQKKRQQLFIKRTTSLASSIDDVNPSIPITNANGIFDTPYVGPSGAVDPLLKYYVLLDGKELVEYTVTGPSALTFCSRGQLGTTAVAHTVGVSADTFWVIEGPLVDIALKLMLSGVNGDYVSGITVTTINQISPSQSVQNAIFFRDVDIQDEYGIIEGDYISQTGATNGGNNFTLRKIVAIVKNNDGSYIVVDGADLISETTTSATISFRSQYDTLGIGFGMTPQDVDVAEHHYWRDLQLNSYQYRFYIKDKIDGKDFLDKEVYAPFGAYSVPRKAKSSMGYHIGPIPRGTMQILDKTTIKNPSKIKLRRTSTRNFYNTIVHSYDRDAIADQFNTGAVNYDADSKARIKAFGNKVLAFQSEGIRTDLSGVANTYNAAVRYLSRYKFGCEFVEGLEVFYKTGFAVEVGDLVVLDPADLKMSNTVTGDRNKAKKFFEVTNKSMDVKTGAVSLDITDTNFDLNQRYATISPSSTVAVGGAKTWAMIQDSYSAVFPGNEPKKWERYVGLPVLIHDENFTFQERVTFLGFDPQVRYKMLFGANLTYPGTNGLSINFTTSHIIDIDTYPATDTDRRTNALYKLFHAYQSPRVTVTGGSSATVFTVGAGDAAKFQKGFPVVVHSEDFSAKSPEVKVLSVVGTTITVDAALGFTPTSSHFVSMLGFADGDFCYRYV